MGKVLFGVIAAFASLMLVDSLVCNNCPFGVAGLCLLPTAQTCAANITNCVTSTASFPSLTSFKGFSSSGCSTNSTACGTTTNSTLLSITYTTSINCCQTDKCNTVSAAPSTKMTFGAVLAVAAVASVWGSMM